MNTKEAIETVESVYRYDVSGVFTAIEKEGIVRCLQRGEKYEAMWGELVYEIIQMTDLDNVNRTIEKIKQRYFPKEEINVSK